MESKELWQQQLANFGGTAGLCKMHLALCNKSPKPRKRGEPNPNPNPFNCRGMYEWKSCSYSHFLRVTFLHVPKDAKGRSAKSKTFFLYSRIYPLFVLIPPEKDRKRFSYTFQLELELALELGRDRNEELGGAELSKLSLAKGEATWNRFSCNFIYLSAIC